MGSLYEEVSTFASTAKNAQKAWNTLHHIFASRSRSRVMQLKSDLGRAQIRNCSVTEFLHSLKSKADELALIDSPMTDDDFTICEISGLGPKFRNIVASIRAKTHSIHFFTLLSMLVA